MGDESNANGVNPIPEDDRKVFAGGLPQEATEADIRDYFAQFGEVNNVNLKMDQMTGRSRGFCFVVFESQDVLDQVLSTEHAIKGKRVAVKKAASKQGKVYVGKFSAPISDDEIKQYFSQYGNVIELQRPVDRSNNNEPKNFCFVTFDKEEPAERLLKQGAVNINGQDVEVKKVTVKTGDMGFGMGMMRGRGGMRGAGGRGGGAYGGVGGGYGGGYNSWGGYGAAAGGWGDYSQGGWGYGGYGGYGGWGGESGGGYGGGGGGGKMNATMGGPGYGNMRGRGTRGGRSAPY